MKLSEYAVPAGLILASALRAASDYTVSTLPNGLGRSALFSHMTGVTLDSQGSLFVIDYDNHTVRKITASGVVTTFAGKTGIPGIVDGVGSAARLWHPIRLSIDRNDTLYVLDTAPGTTSYFSYIRAITSTGQVKTLAWSLTQWGYYDPPGYWWSAVAMTADRLGNTYVHEGRLNRISKISPTGDVSVFFAPGYDGFDNPDAMAVDAAGNLYATGWIGSHSLKRITPEGQVSELLHGDAFGLYDGPGGKVQIGELNGLAVGPNGDVFATDGSRAAVYRIAPTGAISQLAGGNGNGRASDGRGLAARFDVTADLCVAPDGTLYVSDLTSIRKVTPAFLPGAQGRSAVPTASAPRFP